MSLAYFNYSVFALPVLCIIAMLVLGIWAAPLVSALAPIADEGSHLLTAATATLSEGSAQ